MYFACVLLGIVAAFAAARWQPPATTLPPASRQALRIAAIGGAIAGAYGLQLVADLCGFSAPLPPAARGNGDDLPLGGRTVLGGLLGGWLAVEIGKRIAGIRAATGGDFALPLAVALCLGRLGCWAAGCCAGSECTRAWYATVDAAGTPRWPVQLVEVAFHGGAAIVLAIAARRRWWPEQRLLAYFASYGVLRFGLEFWRQHPPVVLGLTWHQGLALVLTVSAAIVWWRRAAQPSHIDA
jgi:phosphatidylglycerol---prolipoprotein diacylglyceryl transferase